MKASSDAASFGDLPRDGGSRILRGVDLCEFVGMTTTAPPPFGKREPSEASRFAAPAGRCKPEMYLVSSM